MIVVVISGSSLTRRLSSIGTFLAVLGLILNVAETAYFGWNLHSGSRLESQMDAGTLTMFCIGILLLIVAWLRRKIEQL